MLALRTLEFDRIVEVVTGLALTPLGGDGVGAARAGDRSEGGRRGAQRDDRDDGISRDATRCFRCARRAGWTRHWRRCEVQGQPLDPLPLRSRRRLPRFGRARADAVRQAAGVVSDPRRASSRAPRASRTRSPPCATPSIRSGEVLDHASPQLRQHPRSAAAEAAAAAHDARAVRARQGHVEVPAGTGRHRAQRPLRADGARRASRQRAGHRARQLGERREPLSRAVGDRRDQQRHRRARGARARGDPPHPARADRRVSRAAGRARGVARRRHRARRAAGEGAVRHRWSTASRRSWPSTAGSSCATRGIRC